MVRSLSIRLKLLFFSLLLLLFLGIAVLTTWLGLSTVTSKLETARLFDKQRVVWMNIHKNINEAMVMQGTVSSRDRIRIGISIFNQGLEGLVEFDILGGRVERELVPLWKEFENDIGGFLIMADIAVDIDAALDGLTKLQKKAQPLDRLMSKLAADTYSAAQNTEEKLRWVVFGIVGLVLVGFVILLISLFRTIAIPLENLSRILIRVEREGDFSIRTEVVRDDEVGRALIAFNHLLEALQATISRITQVMEHLAEENYSKRLKLGYSGDLQQIETAVNSTAIALQRNIEARTAAERQVKLLSTGVEQSPVSIVITDQDGDIEYVNQAFQNTTGYSQQEVLGKNPRVLKSGKTPAHNYMDLWETITAGKVWVGELQNLKKNGNTYWEKAHIAPVLDEQGAITHFLAMKMDITVQKRQEEEILRQAHFDSLTKLPNRFLSLDRLSELVKAAQRDNHHLAVLFLDLDDFKKVNDSLGHEIGDYLLIMAAERLKSLVREQDTVGRLGGDEFIILLDQIKDEADVARLAGNMVKRVGEGFNIDGRELVMTTSIGIAFYPEDGAEASVLLRNADMAMYHAKEEGRNGYKFFTDSMNQGVARRLQLEEHLRTAMEREELYLAYQPLVALDERRIFGAEVLMRWRSKELGDVSPEEFIAIAEQTGLIQSMGDYVLEQAIAQAVRWREVIGDFKIAVNVSPMQFRDPDFVMRIQGWLEQYGLPGNGLELEITENVLMSGQLLVDDALSEIDRLGIGISMDDFGTGYSSLSYLRSYSFDTLKIDRSFIGDITDDPGDLELVVATLRMAHGLGLKVVAEGVETDQQLALLEAHECDIGQGWLFGRPVPADEFEHLHLNGAT